MDRPTTDYSKGIPLSPETWEWREYADHLERRIAELEKFRKNDDRIILGLKAENKALKAALEKQNTGPTHAERQDGYV